MFDFVTLMWGVTFQAYLPCLFNETCSGMQAGTGQWGMNI